MATTLASVHIYPVKGCRGLSPATAVVAATGLVAYGVGDREWMIVDGDGKFVTQREHPRLALVETAIDDGKLRLTVPRLASTQVATLELPLARSNAVPESRAVTVWRSDVRGFDEGDAAAAWLSSWLAVPVRLVRFDRATPRRCNPDFAGATGAHTLFADGYPVLVIGSASLAELNARLAARGSPAMPMNRFRPNIVLDGIDAHAEDHIDRISIGAAVLHFVKPCVRCQVTTTDQATAHVGLEPLRTLGEYRMDERLGGVTFGMNAIPRGGTGERVALGATVAIDYRF